MNKIDICIGIFVCLEPTGCNPYFLLHKIKKRLSVKCLEQSINELFLSTYIDIVTPCMNITIYLIMISNAMRIFQTKRSVGRFLCY